MLNAESVIMLVQLLLNLSHIIKTSSMFSWSPSLVACQLMGHQQHAGTSPMYSSSSSSSSSSSVVDDLGMSTQVPQSKKNSSHGGCRHAAWHFNILHALYYEHQHLNMFISPVTEFLLCRSTPSTFSATTVQ